MADKMMRIAGRTSGGVAVPMSADDNGRINTNRHWNTELISLYVGAVTNTDEIRAEKIDMSEYPIISIRITNRTGVPILITPLVDLYNTNNGYELKDIDGSSLAVEIPSSNHFCIMHPGNTPWLNYVKYLRLKFAATETPTENSPSVEIIAVVRK